MFVMPATIITPRLRHCGRGERRVTPPRGHTGTPASPASTHNLASFNLIQVIISNKGRLPASGLGAKRPEHPSPIRVPPSDTDTRRPKGPASRSKDARPDPKPTGWCVKGSIAGHDQDGRATGRNAGRVRLGLAAARAESPSPVRELVSESQLPDGGRPQRPPGATGPSPARPLGRRRGFPEPQPQAHRDMRACHCVARVCSRRHHDCQRRPSCVACR